MANWQEMGTAPRDGTAIQARIPGHGSDNVIIWIEGMVDGCDQHAGAWAFALDDQEPPSCWTDGACWAYNEDGKPSVLPAAWMPLSTLKRPEHVSKVLD